MSRRRGLPLRSLMLTHDDHELTTACPPAAISVTAHAFTMSPPCAFLGDVQHSLSLLLVEKVPIEPTRVWGRDHLLYAVAVPSVSAISRRRSGTFVLVGSVLNSSNALKCGFASGCYGIEPPWHVQSSLCSRRMALSC